MITLRIAAISFALLLVACSRSKTVSTQSGDVKVEESGKSGQSTVTITGRDGEKVTIASQGTKLPADYPKDVPVASSAKIVMATSVNGSGNNGYSLVLESGDSFDKTVAFYKKELADSGWQSSATVAVENMAMFTATKDTRQLIVQITETDGKCSVTQTIGKK